MKEKLKTLEDFEIKGIVDNLNNKRMATFISKEELKVEAVKWVKSLENYSAEYKTTDEPEIIGWIEHFFNLTSEDLK